MSSSQSPTPISSVGNTHNSITSTPSQSKSTSHNQTPGNTESDCELLNEETILSELKNDQLVIDATEKFLLNFKFQKRNRGRPKAGAVGATPELPETVYENLRSITDINDLLTSWFLYFQESEQRNHVAARKTPQREGKE